ncbi:MAG: hypothetical protein JWP91_1810 [Fibrobacteres bacterium]|nr:hypothetical protein [Fibrobacterota bacterium]
MRVGPVDPARPGKPAPLASLSLLALLSLLAVACAPSAPRSTVPPSDASYSEYGNKPQTRARGAAAPASAKADPQSIRYQLIYVVHGDAGYAYYDKAGVRRYADTEAVAQAVEVAANSPSAEVFIFHQKPTPFLWFFRGSDGTMRHYRKGRLLRTEGYDRATREDDLGAEAALYRKYSLAPVPVACPPEAAPGGPIRFFIYFGHEIPVTGGIPYSRSRPDMAFSVASFARGLERFGGPACPHAKPFSLIVLSACHGGTPAATAAIAPYASYLLASPGELHLSYLDTRAFARLARENPLPYETVHAEAWGRAIAVESFARLQERTSTAITLSLYDTEKSAAYLEARRSLWKTADGQERKRVDTPSSQAAETYRDCAENPSFGSGGEEAGVTVYFHAPRFGLDKSRVFRSGWECPVLASQRMGDNAWLERPFFNP